MRRGISEVVSSVILLAVFASMSYFVLGSFSTNISSTQTLASDSLKIEADRAHDLMEVITTNSSNNEITLEIINYGIRKIPIDSVFVDGIESPFQVSDAEGRYSVHNSLEPRQISVLKIAGSGHTIQILTGSKNLFNIPV